MADEMQTRACAACGFPTIGTMRRCPYCRVPLPRVSGARRGRAGVRDPLSALAILWAVLMLPAALLALGTFGPPLALFALGVGLTPACFVGALQGRTRLRIKRFQRRGRAARPSVPGLGAGDPAGSEQPPSDARRR